jgi:F0F1-type ATP synthase assembly protein I
MRESEPKTMTGHSGSKQDLNLRKMASRMVKAARLNGDTFRELRDDPSATVQSLSLIAIVGLCYGAGLGLFGFSIAGISMLEVLIITLIGLLAAFVIALVLSITSLLIVRKLFRGRIGYWALARPFFFSWTPGLLFILMSEPIPLVFDIVRATSTVWICIATVFAVKNAVGISTQQSLLTFITSTVSLIFVGTILLSLIQFLIIR